LTTRRRRLRAAEETYPGASREEIRPVSESDKINIMLYAWPGVGKTRFIGSTDRPAHSLIIRPPQDHTDSIRGTGVQEWVVHNWTEMSEALEYLRESRGDGFEWVWLDSISLYQDVGLDDIWEGVVARNPRRNQFGLDKGEYGINMTRLARWIRFIVGMQAFNFGVTAHPNEIPDPFDESGERTMLMPWVQGKQMAEKICGYMNIVAYIRVVKDAKSGEYRRVMYANATDRWYGKDQFDCLTNGRLLDPTLPKLVSKIEASK
jgi:AAA domain